MKKIIFTFCSIAIVCCAIFFACAKDDNNITHVTYVSQTKGGTGSNPNPNGAPSNSGYGTTTATTATTTTGSTTSTTSGTTTAPTNTTTTNFSVDGSAATPSTPNAVASGGNFVILCIDNSGDPQVQITFPGTSAPISGNYTIVSGTPTGNQCNFLVTTTLGASGASAGTVVVTAATSPNNTAAFGSIACSGAGGSHTVTGAIKY
jgi:hypothetical protein